eukprot:g27407.t1
MHFLDQDLMPSFTPLLPYVLSEVAEENVTRIAASFRFVERCKQATACITRLTQALPEKNHLRGSRNQIEKALGKMSLQQRLESTTKQLEVSHQAVRHAILEGLMHFLTQQRKAFSALADLPGDVLGRLMKILLKFLSESISQGNRSSQLLCGQVLGAFGAIDPARLAGQARNLSGDLLCSPTSFEGALEEATTLLPVERKAFFQACLPAAPGNHTLALFLMHHALQELIMAPELSCSDLASLAKKLVDLLTFTGKDAPESQETATAQAVFSGCALIQELPELTEHLQPRSVEAAWQLSSWQRLEEALEAPGDQIAAKDFQVQLGDVLLHLHGRDEVKLQQRIQETTVEVACAASLAAREVVTHEACLAWLILTACLPYLREEPGIAQNLLNRCDITTPSFSARQSLLAPLRVALQESDLNLRNEAKSIELAFSRLCRKHNETMLMEHPDSSFQGTSSDLMVSAQLEWGKILYARGARHEALRHMLVLSKTSPRAQLLGTRWATDASLLLPRVAEAEFLQAKEKLNDEASFFYHAAYLDYLLKGQISDATNSLLQATPASKKPRTPEHSPFDRKNLVVFTFRGMTGATLNWAKISCKKLEGHTKIFTDCFALGSKSLRTAQILPVPAAIPSSLQRISLDWLAAVAGPNVGKCWMDRAAIQKTADGRGFFPEVILSERCLEHVEVFRSKESPKRVTFVGTDGRHYPFLCKAEKRGDLRKDLTPIDEICPCGPFMWSFCQRNAAFLNGCPTRKDCDISLMSCGKVANKHARALWCMLGYLVGLGDRHLENILIDTESGRLVHVDFDCLFNKGMLLERPEMVPFRLTQNCVAAMGITGVEGIFRQCCEVTMEVLRDRGNTQTLLSVLHVFVADPLLEITKRVAASELAEHRVQTARDTISEVEKKLKGMLNVVERMRSLLGRDRGVGLSVKGQVDELIKAATCKRNLSEMYVGWQPWL